MSQYIGYDQDSIAVLTKRYRQVHSSHSIPPVISYLEFDEYLEFDSIFSSLFSSRIFLGFAVRIITPTPSITQLHIHFVYIYLILSICFKK